MFKLQVSMYLELHYIKLSMLIEFIYSTYLWLADYLIAVESTPSLREKFLLSEVVSDFSIFPLSLSFLFLSKLTLT